MNLESLNLRLIDAEEKLTAWGVYRMKKLHLPKKLIEEIDDAPCEPPTCPKESISVRLKTPRDPSCIKLVRAKSVIRMYSGGTRRRRANGVGFFFTIFQNNSVKNNSKITSFFNVISSSASQNSSNSNVNVVNNATPVAPLKCTPIYRNVIAQGEVSSKLKISKHLSYLRKFVLLARNED